MSTFSLKKMTLRKTAILNRVKFIPQSERTKERDIESNTMKNNSLLHKQKKKLSQNN